MPPLLYVWTFPSNKATSLFKDVKKTKETTLVNLVIPLSSQLSMESNRKHQFHPQHTVTMHSIVFLRFPGKRKRTENLLHWNTITKGKLRTEKQPGAMLTLLQVGQQNHTEAEKRALYRAEAQGAEFCSKMPLDKLRKHSLHKCRREVLHRAPPTKCHQSIRLHFTGNILKCAPPPLPGFQCVLLYTL